ncbi:hypothetical protein [Pandoravirus japonicus]|uniref:Uncharacterized protein n=1 Tax=Pandoravirus japonicus TaxID=2823154 RepID=A0A811BNF0_9VIRU|nr:hypothetical protein [Pandoravirus japonicus]
MEKIHFWALCTRARAPRLHCIFSRENEMTASLIMVGSAAGATGRAGRASINGDPLPRLNLPTSFFSGCEYSARR